MMLPSVIVLVLLNYVPIAYSNQPGPASWNPIEAQAIYSNSNVKNAYQSNEPLLQQENNSGAVPIAYPGTKNNDFVHTSIQNGQQIGPGFISYQNPQNYLGTHRALQQLGPQKNDFIRSSPSFVQNSQQSGPEFLYKNPQNVPGPQNPSQQLNPQENNFIRSQSSSLQNDQQTGPGFLYQNPQNVPGAQNPTQQLSPQRNDFIRSQSSTVQNGQQIGPGFSYQNLQNVPGAQNPSQQLSPQRNHFIRSQSSFDQNGQQIGPGFTYQNPQNVPEAQNDIRQLSLQRNGQGSTLPGQVSAFQRFTQNQKLKEIYTASKPTKRYTIIHLNGTVEHTDELQTIAARNPNYVLLKADDILSNNYNRPIQNQRVYPTQIKSSTPINNPDYSVQSTTAPNQNVGWASTNTFQEVNHNQRLISNWQGTSNLNPVYQNIPNANIQKPVVRTTQVPILNSASNFQQPIRLAIQQPQLNQFQGEINSQTMNQTLNRLVLPNTLQSNWPKSKDIGANQVQINNLASIFQQTVLPTKPQLQTNPKNEYQVRVSSISLIPNSNGLTVPAIIPTPTQISSIPNNNPVSSSEILLSKQVTNTSVNLKQPNPPTIQRIELNPTQTYQGESNNQSKIVSSDDPPIPTIPDTVTSTTIISSVSENPISSTEKNTFLSNHQIASNQWAEQSMIADSHEHATFSNPSAIYEPETIQSPQNISPHVSLESANILQGKQNTSSPSKNLHEKAVAANPLPIYPEMSTPDTAVNILSAANESSAIGAAAMQPEQQSLLALPSNEQEIILNPPIINNTQEAIAALNSSLSISYTDIQNQSSTINLLETKSTTSNIAEHDTLPIVQTEIETPSFIEELNGNASVYKVNSSYNNNQIENNELEDALEAKNSSITSDDKTNITTMNNTNTGGIVQSVANEPSSTATVNETWLTLSNDFLWETLRNNTQNVYFFFLPPRPKVTKETKTTIFPNGTILEEIIETALEFGQDEPKVSKTTRLVQS